MIFAAETVQPRQEGGDKQQRHAESKEKLGDYEKCWKKEVMDDVVFLFEDPPTPCEPSVVVVAEILKIDEANLPQSCKKQTKLVLGTVRSHLECHSYW